MPRNNTCQGTYKPSLESVMIWTALLTTLVMVWLTTILGDDNDNDTWLILPLLIVYPFAIIQSLACSHDQYALL